HPNAPLPSSPTRRSSDLDRELLVALADTEPRRHPPAHRYRAVHALDPADQLEPRQQPAVIERDGVYDPHLSRSGRERRAQDVAVDRKSTRLNSSHRTISY